MRICASRRLCLAVIAGCMADRTIIIRSLSKSHAMTGWRWAGWWRRFHCCGIARSAQSCDLWRAGVYPARRLGGVHRFGAGGGEMKQAYRERRDAFVQALSRVNSLDCSRTCIGYILHCRDRPPGYSGTGICRTALPMPKASRSCREKLSGSPFRLGAGIAVPADPVLHDAVRG